MRSILHDVSDCSLVWHSAVIEIKLALAAKQTDHIVLTFPVTLRLRFFFHTLIILLLLIILPIILPIDYFDVNLSINCKIYPEFYLTISPKHKTYIQSGAFLKKFELFGWSFAALPFFPPNSWTCIIQFEHSCWDQSNWAVWAQKFDCSEGVLKNGVWGNATYMINNRDD